MVLWELRPVDLADPNWEASSYRGVAIVRARSENAARRAAQDAFGVKTRFRTFGRVLA
jgi:Flp pilus assembly protein TadD